MISKKEIMRGSMASDRSEPPTKCTTKQGADYCFKELSGIPPASRICIASPRNLEYSGASWARRPDSRCCWPALANSPSACRARSSSSCTQRSKSAMAASKPAGRSFLRGMRLKLARISGESGGTVARSWALVNGLGCRQISPSLRPATTDWRERSGGALRAEPATATEVKPCSVRSACQPFLHKK